jgi:hypothetical protein
MKTCVHFFMMSRSTVLTKKSRLKIVVETKTNILYSLTFFKMCLYEEMCKIMALPDKTQMLMLSLAF